MMPADGTAQNQGMEQPTIEISESPMGHFFFMLVRRWGMLFRTIFIVAVGFIGYFWADPESLGDIPFAELTLNRIIGNFLAVLIPLGCLVWFFNFPDQMRAKAMKENPYVIWGQFGGVVVLVILGAYCFLAS